MNRGTWMNVGIFVAIVAEATYRAVLVYGNHDLYARFLPVELFACTSVFIGAWWYSKLIVRRAELIALRGDLAARLSNDPAMGRQLARKVVSDDARTLFRLKVLRWLAMIGLALGVAYVLILNYHLPASGANVVAAAFTGATAATLAFYMWLVVLVPKLRARDIYINREYPLR